MLNPVSILITSFQRPHLLMWNLHSLAGQKIPFPFETIVLNDGVPDETASLCRQFERTLNLKYVFTGQRNLNGLIKYRVPGFALNIGAQISRGDVLIISCAEMFHLNNTVEMLAAPVRLNHKLLATAIGMDDHDGSFLEYINRNKGHCDIRAYHQDYPRLNTALPFLMAISRSEFFAIGGYDEDFTGWAYDDNDLVDRLVAHGCRLCLTQALTIHLYHPRHDTGREQTPEYQFNRNLYLKGKDRMVRNTGKEWGRIILPSQTGGKI